MVSFTSYLEKEQMRTGEISKIKYVHVIYGCFTYVVSVHSTTPLTPSLEEIMISATKPWVSEERTTFKE